MKRRSFLKAGAGAIAAPALAAPHVASAQGQRTIKFVPQADLAILDPVFTTALVSRTHGFLVYDQLYGLDDSFTPQPQLVEGHVIENDGKTWKITLRDAKFHDGTPILARDAIASMQRWMSIDAFGQNVRSVTDELTAASDRVIQFRLKKPFPLLPTALAKPSAFCPILPERLAKTPVNQQITDMTGSGPFKFVPGERMAGARAVYEKWAGYVPRSSGTPSFAAGPKIAYVDRVEWHTIPDAATAAAALQSGEIDWWEQPQPDLLPLLRKNKDIVIEAKERGGLMGMIRFNHLLPPFDNPAIRRALIGGVSQTDHMQAVMGDERSLWDDKCGFFVPGSPFATQAGMEVMTGPRDMEKVKRDLLAAGYKNELVTFLVPTDLPALNAMSQVVADMCKKVGLNVDYQASDWGTVVRRLTNQDTVEKGGWNMWCNYIPGIIAVTPATQSYVRGLGKSGPFGWPASPKIEELRNNFLDASDLADQKKLCTDIQLQAFQDVPYIPTGWWMQPFAYRKSLTDMLNGFPLFHNVKKA